MELIEIDLPDLPRAVCTTHPPGLWHESQRHPAKVAEAVRLCGTCPEKAACLTWALDRREQWGVWGGLTEDQRAEIRTPKRPRVVEVVCGTRAGEYKHRRLGEPVCEPCRMAGNEYQRAGRAARAAARAAERSLRDG